MLGGQVRKLYEVICREMIYVSYSSKTRILLLYFATLFLMFLTINKTYLTSYTGPVLELSKSFCKGVPYLERVEPFYADVIEVVSSGKHAFAGPIGVSLLLSPIACFADTLWDMLVPGGIAMCLCVFLSMIFTHRFLESVLPKGSTHVFTAIVISVLASMPWVYSSHIFPQALLVMCYSGILYFSTKIILGSVVRIKQLIPHAVLSSLAFLADPSTAILTAVITTLIVVEKRSLFTYSAKKAIKLAAVWAATTTLISIPQLLYNYAVTGNIFVFPEFRYSEMRGLGTGFSVSHMVGALVAQLFDYRKSLLSLYPASFISLMYVPKALKYISNKAVKILYVLMVITPILVYSSWHDFHGGLSYGPRFLAPITILLSLPLSIILDSGGKLLKLLILVTSFYSLMENAVVLVSTPYPCAFQDLGFLENQFYSCSLKCFLGGSRSALIADLIAEYSSMSPLAVNILSAKVVFLAALLIVLTSHASKM